MQYMSRWILAWTKNEMSYRTAFMYGWTGKEALFADAYIKQWDAIEAQKDQEKQVKKASRHAVIQQ